MLSVVVGMRTGSGRRPTGSGRTRSQHPSRAGGCQQQPQKHPAASEWGDGMTPWLS
jgi:hypothetical protein